MMKVGVKSGEHQRVEHDNREIKANDGNHLSQSKECEVAIVLFMTEQVDKSVVSGETYKRTKVVLGGNNAVLSPVKLRQIEMLELHIIKDTVIFKPTMRCQYCVQVLTCLHY